MISPRFVAVTTYLFAAATLSADVRFNAWTTSNSRRSAYLWSPKKAMKRPERMSSSAKSPTPFGAGVSGASTSSRWTSLTTVFGHASAYPYAETASRPPALQSVTLPPLTIRSATGP
eukprot:scaffold735_cov255-Pinguiococcus_pyrenoidosus.AAC.1